jgi:hypothetical protein
VRYAASRFVAAIRAQLVGHGREHLNAFHRQAGRQWVRIMLPDDGGTLARTACRRRAPLEQQDPVDAKLLQMVGRAGAGNAATDNHNVKHLTHAAIPSTTGLEVRF